MAKPPTALAFPQALSPKGKLEYSLFIMQGPPGTKPAPVLLPGEGIKTYALGLGIEAMAAGLRIMTGVDENGDDRTDRLDGNTLKVWFDVDEDMRGSSIFDGAGVEVPVHVPIETTAHPSRGWELTFLVRIVNQ